MWYYHSGRSSIRLFRRHDATMIANYAMVVEVTSILSTSWSILAGDRDGAVTMLAVVDPQNREKTASVIENLPSRKREKTEVNGGLVKNPLAKFRASVRIAMLLNRLVEFFINKKKERKKKRKKGELLEAICKVT